MEDAMIINKSAYERGFGHGTVYKSYLRELNEGARIENVRLMGDEKDPSHCSLGYTIRYSRNPVIGDKFSSRHGQKGVLSQLWP
jgi:DNA-directed RNA polymerase beta subunit